MSVRVSNVSNTFAFGPHALGPQVHQGQAGTRVSHAPGSSGPLSNIRCGLPLHSSNLESGDELCKSKRLEIGWRQMLNSTLKHPPIPPLKPNHPLAKKCILFHYQCQMNSRQYLISFLSFQLLESASLQLA